MPFRYLNLSIHFWNNANPNLLLSVFGLLPNRYRNYNIALVNCLLHQMRKGPARESQPLAFVFG